MSGIKILTGHEFLKELCDALDVKHETIQRIVLDIPYNDIVTAYIQQIGTEKLLSVKMQSDGIEIKVI